MLASGKPGTQKLLWRLLGGWSDSNQLDLSSFIFTSGPAPPASRGPGAFYVTVSAPSPVFPAFDNTHLFTL